MVTKTRKETVTEEKTVETWEECDKCGFRVVGIAYHHFECREGDSYPDGGSGVTLDLCAGCREDFWKLLMENGFNPHKYSW